MHQPNLQVVRIHNSKFLEEGKKFGRIRQQAPSSWNIRNIEIRKLISLCRLYNCPIASIKLPTFLSTMKSHWPKEWPIRFRCLKFGYLSNTTLEKEKAVSAFDSILWWWIFGVKHPDHAKIKKICRRMVYSVESKAVGLNAFSFSIFA